MATEETRAFVSKAWDESVVPLMCEYVQIENVSLAYDPKCLEKGLDLKAAHLLHDWAKKQDVQGMKSEILQLPGLTPLIFIEIDATDPSSVSQSILMYGHLDKQPPLTESWAEGLHPYKPVIRDGKLYGRGAADDGYAICAAVLSVKALQLQAIPHGRIVIIIEACEESDTSHLKKYVDHLMNRIGSPSLIVCLDSGAGNYEQFWLTTSLRGFIFAKLTVSILREGVHSGKASGTVPSSFRIMRQLLDRIEDSRTGEILIPEFNTELPEHRKEQVARWADTVKDKAWSTFPFVEGAVPVDKDPQTTLVKASWKPSLSYVGIDGVPNIASAGNVLRTHTTLGLSFRLPPTVDSNAATAALKKAVESDPPYGAKVTCTIDDGDEDAGWDSPPLEPYITAAVDKASQFFFNKPANFISEGGTIPFMGMLGKKFPEAQFVITGVLGPETNAHGPNEFLPIEFGKKITACVSSIVADHFAHFAKK